MSDNEGVELELDQYFVRGNQRRKKKTFQATGGSSWERI